MKFNIMCEDYEYVEAIKRYYQKHSDDIELLFNDVDADCITICDPSYVDDKTLGFYLIFSDKNQVMTKEINKYQSGRDFLMFLSSINETDLKGVAPFRLFGLVNGISSSGVTTLSLNLADYLCGKGKTLWFSIEDSPSTMYYMNKRSGLSFSDVLFYLENDMECLKTRIESWQMEGLYWFDQVELMEDLNHTDVKLLVQLFDVLEGAGFTNVVIDLGFQIRWRELLNFNAFIIVMAQEMRDYYRFSFKFKDYDFKDSYVFINKRQVEGINNEAVLKMMNHYYYIDEDYDLEERVWISKITQSTIAKHLNIT